VVSLSDRQVFYLLKNLQILKVDSQDGTNDQMGGTMNDDLERKFFVIILLAVSSSLKILWTVD